MCIRDRLYSGTDVRTIRFFIEKEMEADNGLPADVLAVGDVELLLSLLAGQNSLIAVDDNLSLIHI